MDLTRLVTKQQMKSTFIRNVKVKNAWAVLWPEQIVKQWLGGALGLGVGRGEGGGGWGYYCRIKVGPSHHSMKIV